RCRSAEESLLHLVVPVHIPIPQTVARLQVPGAQVAVRAEGVDLLASDEGRRSRTVVEPEVIFVSSAVCGLPSRLSGRGFDALDRFVLADAMEEDQPVARDDRAGPAMANVLGPKNCRPIFPRPEQPGLRGMTVALGAEVLRPICGDEERDRGKEEPIHR